MKIPAPTAADEYRTYLKSAHWATVRAAALERASHRCQLCNRSSKLHVHHRTYERVGCEEPYDLTVLCADCHDWFHKGRTVTAARRTQKKAKREPQQKAPRPKPSVTLRSGAHAPQYVSKQAQKRARKRQRGVSPHVRKVADENERLREIQARNRERIAQQKIARNSGQDVPAP